MGDNFWILAFSYWLHLMATVVWFAGLLLIVLAAWGALRQGALEANQWVTWQRRFAPWVSGSFIVLLITGFVQMTHDVNYTGFLTIDSVWAWAMLLKHIAFAFLVILTLYMQVGLYPAMGRIGLLAEKRPQLAQKEEEKLARQEKRLLRLNLLLAALILLFTALATAV